MNDQKRRAIFERLRAANPAPRTELHYQSPFELLVAVILSAQATDKSVNKATVNLFRAANTPAAVLELGVDGLSRHIKSIGLFNSKAKNLVATCRLLLERHAGTVPTSREELERLPGVGRKTANVILNTAFGEATIAVDTHIFRVANRTGFGAGQDRSRGGGQAPESRAARVSTRRAPLVDPFTGDIFAGRASRPARPAPSWIFASIVIRPMSLFDASSREQLRKTYADALAKHLARAPLTPLEAIITDVIGAHPEYQAIVERLGGRSGI